MSDDGRPLVLLTVDLEDWHQLVGRAIGQHHWDVPHTEFVQQVDDALALLHDLGVRATFFVLGITAKNHPQVVEQIACEGHEIACHGWAHVRAWQQSESEFRRDVELGVGVLERLGMPAPAGYRAPAFSLTRKTPWALRVLADLGFRYDSSHYDTPLVPDRAPAPATGQPVAELPIAVARFGSHSVPIGGGSYWRVLPRRLILSGIERLAAESRPPVLYFHPCELGSASLRVRLLPGTSVPVRARAAWKTARYNVGRARVTDLLAETSQRVRLVPCSAALAKLKPDQVGAAL
jgi:polysaccharide deacetylase family protein (PEP-CTERM system associated)